MKLNIPKIFNIDKWIQNAEPHARYFVWWFGIILALATVVNIHAILSQRNPFTLCVLWICFFLFMFAGGIVSISELRRSKQKGTEIRQKIRWGGEMNHSRIFYEEMKAKMVTYKTKTLGITEKGKRTIREKGTRNPITLEYEHILPARLWTQNLWSGIRQAAVNYFSHEKIKWHDQRDNLLSSQILCVNIFFPLRNHLPLVNGFLKKFYPSLAKVTDIDFEYIGPRNRNYLKEPGGRGYNRTSADVAITWEDIEGKNNLLLVEFKFTEPNFGECSKSENPDRDRCNHGEVVISSPQTECYRSEVGRPYWEMVLSPQGPFIREMLNRTQYCPFRYDFYQLMRNQLLAKCIAEDKDSGFHVAEFAVCYDDRNETLLNLSHPIDSDSNPLTSWKSFLKNPSSFKHFTIQQLLKHIDHTDNLPSELKQWRAYLNTRYGL